MTTGGTEVRAEAGEAFLRGDIERVRLLLLPLIGDKDYQALLGTFLSLREDTYAEGVEMLRMAADAGSGLAANNLATCLAIGGPGCPRQPDMAERYRQMALDSGFLETVVTNPTWWKQK
jgi:hypothetical protein